MTILTHHEETTAPGTPCWETPGISSPWSGYFSSSCCPPRHKLRQRQSSTPTSRRWRQFGKPRPHRGDQQTTRHHNTICRNLTGNNTSTKPANTTNKATSPNRLTQPYIGPYNNSKPYPTYNKSGPIPYKKYKHSPSNGRTSHNDGSRHYQHTANPHTNNHT